MGTLGRRMALSFLVSIIILVVPWMVPVARSAVTHATEGPTTIYTIVRRTTVTNTGNRAMHQLLLETPLLNMVGLNGTIIVTSVSSSPVSLTADQHGNTMAVFRIANLPAHRRLVVTFRYQAMVRKVHFNLHPAGSRYHINSLYIRYTSPAYGHNEGIDTNAPAIVSLDRRLLGKTTNPSIKAHILFRWITRHIRYNYTLKPSGTALATLRQRTGICTDFATLYVSMLRTAHIPARLVGGYLLDSATATNAFHDWVQFYLPGIGWVSADPTWGSGYFGSISDTYHIPLYFGLEPNITIYGQRAGSRAITVMSSFTVSQQTHPPRLLTAYDWTRLPFEPIWATRLSEWMLN